MKKYSSIVWLALCLGFTGNVAFGENENVDLSEDQSFVAGNDTAALVAPEQGNLTTKEALEQFLKVAEGEYGVFLGLKEGQDLQGTIYLINAFLSQPVENQTLDSVFDFKKTYYDERPEVQFVLDHLYEVFVTAYFVTGEHYYLFFPFILAEWYSKGLVNTLAMNAIASHMSHAWVPGNNSWIDAFAKTLVYTVGINYMKDSNLSTLVSQMSSDVFAYASYLLEVDEDSSSE